MYISIDMLYKIVSIVVVVAAAAAICCFRCHNEWNKVESGDIAGESYSPKSYFVCNFGMFWYSRCLFVFLI